MTKTPAEWSLDGFVEHLTFVHEKMLDHKFVWILGAGASLASGIPLGSTLVERWLEELCVREGGSDVSVKDWATAENLGIDSFSYGDRASFYPRIYQRRFHEYPDEGYAYLEDIMSKKDPSPGYSILAAALDSTRHNAVVSTNFDNLVADALSIYTDTFPFICGHESLTGFVRVAMRRPLICKIHRDLLMAPQNEPRSLRRLHDAWGSALRALFEHYTPIFIGYGGNDDTLMDLLESLEIGDIKGQMIWCFHESSKPSDRIVNVVEDHRGILVPVPDFDLLMLLIGERMGISLLDEEIGKRARQRNKRYRNRIEQFDVVKYPQVAKALAATMERSGGVWAYDRRSEQISDLDEREAFLRRGLHLFPKESSMFNALGVFLADLRGAHQEATKQYQKALELDPDEFSCTVNLAESFMILAKYGDARKYLNVANDLPGNDEKAAVAIVLGILDRAEGKDDRQAVTYARFEMEANPSRTYNFAPLLKFVQRALDPDDANFYSTLIAASKDPATLPELDQLLNARYSEDKKAGRKKAKRNVSSKKTTSKKKTSRKKPTPKKKSTQTGRKTSKTKKTKKKR